ncbi:MAG TPA: hypothetical protein VEW45_07245, partial [Candidatus Dormibacteraeota bacterium]|nr:hypothetical protein [Candidatus Dormibacteraeota bacterium]
MQNDERDPRDVPPDERGDAPPDERPDDEDEFETASWPVQDVSAAASPSTPEAVQPDAAPEADATEAEAAPAADADAGPPPPEVEAYATPPATAAPVVAAHSVPATEPGESTLCPRCRTENRPG